MTQDVRKFYDKLKARHKLPKLEDLENDFSLELKSPGSLLQDIISSITNVLSDNSKMIESLIFVDSGSPASHLYEATMLNSNKLDLFELYKKLNSLYWAGKKVKIKSDEKEMASYINTCTERWNKFKAELLKMCETFEREWNDVELRETEEFASYHG